MNMGIYCGMAEVGLRGYGKGYGDIVELLQRDMQI